LLRRTSTAAAAAQTSGVPVESEGNDRYLDSRYYRPQRTTYGTYGCCFYDGQWMASDCAPVGCSNARFHRRCFIAQPRGRRKQQRTARVGPSVSQSVSQSVNARISRPMKKGGYGIHGMYIWMDYLSHIWHIGSHFVRAGSGSIKLHRAKICPRDRPW
jgi:hypothetical protein